jgi:ABC-type Zn uptake system ZnuABC Zn-binding protein ZnuA
MNTLFRNKTPFAVFCLISLILSGCGPKENATETGNGGHEPAHAEGGAPCVIVSTTDLKGIVEAIAGDKVELHCFGKGNQDPHQLDILPSYVREMNDADLWIQVGNDIEAAWYPDLIANIKNPGVLEGAEGYLDVSKGVTPMEGVVGDVLGVGHSSGFHPSGNPHYLLDPMEGIRVAEEIATRLSDILPAEKSMFETNLKAFKDKLATALVGKELAEKHDIVELADYYMNNSLGAFLKEQGHGIALQGWLGALQPYRGTPIVGDHDLWPYFCRRIGLSVVGYFEPEPGIPPTTKHLQVLISQMKSQSVEIILSAPYFDERHAEFVSENTGATALPMCHQTDARPGTESYFDMIRHNMETVIAALKKGDPGSNNPK